MPNLLERLIPRRWRKTTPLVHVVRLTGTIGVGTPFKPPLTMEGLAPTLERAFARKGISAVALVINSPGGAAVQSALIHARIRALAEEKKIPVFTFCEDVAASGGYWLACAGDEIYADSSSIVGSIGVIAAGFGFVEAIKKLGVERRVHTAGESKAILDPFQPEKPEDVERLKSLQRDVHEDFKALVRSRRNGKLRGEEAELFSGAFWSGRQALALGLIDGIGHLRDIMRARFGEKTEFKVIAKPQGWGLRRLGFGMEADPVSGLIDAMEIRALWGRFGL
ncbi:S49 family peptidase [Taklimakanibacter deserti]|uniref:S49 family peptidase n=1 Tax=Taklimakanibacter deserti TaxID=2267839 RepID=UPI000E650AB8